MNQVFDDLLGAQILCELLREVLDPIALVLDLIFDLFDILQYATVKPHLPHHFGSSLINQVGGFLLGIAVLVINRNHIEAVVGQVWENIIKY